MKKLLEESQRTLRNKLEVEGVEEAIITSLCESGYSLMSATLGGTNSVECIQDSFYGSKSGIGLVPFSDFIKHISDQKLPKANIPAYKVNSLKMIKDILNTEQYKNYFGDGLMSFRGQTSEYLTQRSFPNPFLSFDNGSERLILPSFWRQFYADWNARFDAKSPLSIFLTVAGDPLTYFGIPDWQSLGKRNVERYGLHMMSDLEDFPDPVSREYGRRWRNVKINGITNPELPLVEQHYGVSTCGLDVTFDLSTAFFFATFDWRLRPDGVTATYTKVPDGKNQGVLYAFVFRDPRLKATSDMVNSVQAFDHIPPVRPLVQKCSLPGFYYHNMNEAVADLAAVFYMEEGIDYTDIPQPADIFPDETQDPFYQAVMTLKRNHPKLGPISKFIEYNFEHIVE